MMDLERYLSLYLSETQDRLRVLNRCLLELEKTGALSSVDEAFRAVHTIKGMAATMGFGKVADQAHALEDLLDEVRSGERTVDRALVDELLARADALEQASDAAVAGGDGEADDNDEAPAPAAGATASYDDEAVPPGTELIIRVVLEDSCQLKAARAMIAQRNASGVATILGTSPQTFGDDFDGTFRFFMGAGVDRDAVAAAIRAAGDVAEVYFEEPGAVPLPAPASTQGRKAGKKAVVHHIRIDQRHLTDLAEGIGDLAVLGGRLEMLAMTLESEALTALAERIQRRIADLEHSILAARMVPVSEVFERFPRVVRDAARALGKEVDFRIEGREIEIDRQILEEVAEPLVHLLRNSLDHGLEMPDEREAAGKPKTGRLTLRAVEERSSILIEVEDDGRGVPREKVADRARELGILHGSSQISDDELLRLLSQPGLSTAERVSDLSGRGVGLDAVVTRIRALGGAVSLRTETSRGTTISVRLPMTLALTQALRVKVAGEDYVIPITHISEALELTPETVSMVDDREVVLLREEELPLIRLGSVLMSAEQGTETAAVVAEIADRRAALAVDELVGREQVVVKAFDVAVGTLPIFSGATLLADGRPALVLDPISVF